MEGGAELHRRRDHVRPLRAQGGTTSPLFSPRVVHVICQSSCQSADLVTFRAILQELQEPQGEERPMTPVAAAIKELCAPARVPSLPSGRCPLAPCPFLSRP